MKELIEKIKKIKYMDYYDCESALDRALELIKEEENKPFNPELLEIEELNFSDVDFFVYQPENKTTQFLLMTTNKKNRIDWSIASWSKKDKAPREPIFNFKIKIPSHRFGVELLKNLGVIE